MKTVKRYDSIKIDAVEVQDGTGFLKIKFRGGRTGTLDYGSHVEFRDEGALQADGFKDTFKSAPVTDDHPRDEIGFPVFVDKTNSQSLMKGFTGEKLAFTEIDGETYGEGHLTVTAADLIAKIMDEGKREISAGYTVDLVDKPGVHKGVAFQFRQENIRNNHFAVVDRGRAGSEASLVLDDDGNQIFDTGEQPNKENPMVKVTIDGKEIEVADQATADALTASFKASEERAEEAKGKADAGEETLSLLEKAQEETRKAKADADEAKGRADAAAKELEEKTSVGNLDEAVKVRSAILADARRILPAEEQAKLDGLDNMGVKRLVLLSRDKDAKVDEMTDAYVDGSFDVMVRASKQSTDDGTDLGEAVLAARETKTADKSDRKVSVDGKDLTPAEAITAHNDSLSTAWQKPIGPLAASK